jgi:hypothetical protein
MRLILKFLGACLNNTVVLEEALITLIVIRTLPYNLGRVPYPMSSTKQSMQSNFLFNNILYIKTGEEHYEQIVQSKPEAALSYIHILVNIWTSISPCYLRTHYFVRRKRPILQDYGFFKALQITSFVVQSRLIWKRRKTGRCIGYIINLVIQAFLFANVIEMGELESYDDQGKNGAVTDEDVGKRVCSITVSCTDSLYD